ncbi:hypothetical protein BDR07DRAFT_1395133 [Suillus spraguei]|nr:hypothetical protein BDR07DRAFT_1395133 [Suillus spraguei]
MTTCEIPTFDSEPNSELPFDTEQMLGASSSVSFYLMPCLAPSKSFSRSVQRTSSL